VKVNNTDRAQRLRELVEAENRLNDALLEHETLEQQNQIYKNQKTFTLKQSRMQNKYELKMKELQYKKQLHALEKEVAALTESEQPKTKKKKTQLHDQLLKEYERIDREYLKKKKKIEESNLSPEAKKLSFKNIESWREQIKEAVDRQFERAIKEEHNE
jgi:hypothetical protein